VVRDGLAAIAKLKGECGAADDIDVRIVRAGGTTLVAPIAGALLASWLLIAASGEAAGEGGAILAALLGVKI
jgi:hypothetical protein